MLLGEKINMTDSQTKFYKDILFDFIKWTNLLSAIIKLYVTLLGRWLQSIYW